MIEFYKGVVDIIDQSINHKLYQNFEDKRHFGNRLGLRNMKPFVEYNNMILSRTGERKS
jgi:hypothetical protein